MNSPSESVRSWARRLPAVEAANQSASETQMQEGVRISEKLRLSLMQFVGPDGFTALLRRALALAKADVPSLQNVNVTADGRLKTMTEFAADAGKDIEAATVITEHLLGLLVTFVGESLTIRLMRNAWPETSLEE